MAESERGLAAIYMAATVQGGVAAGLGLKAAPMRHGDTSEARKQLVEYPTGIRRFDSRSICRVARHSSVGYGRCYWAIPMANDCLTECSWRRRSAGTVCQGAAAAVGVSPLPIVLPCHRVIAQDASIGGFSWAAGKTQIARA